MKLAKKVNKVQTKETKNCNSYNNSVYLLLTRCMRLLKPYINATFSEKRVLSEYQKSVIVKV